MSSIADLQVGPGYADIIYCPFCGAQVTVGMSVKDCGHLAYTYAEAHRFVAHAQPAYKSWFDEVLADHDIKDVLAAVHQKAGERPVLGLRMIATGMDCGPGSAMVAFGFEAPGPGEEQSGD